MSDDATAAFETQRLAVLRSYDILDTPPEETFDELAQAAARICGVPIAAVSLVDEARQFFKAEVGLGVSETPRDISFCTHAMWQDELFVVPDTTKDPVFSSNPLVTGAPDIRFYAGAALRSPEGVPLGALCVIDREARPQGLTPEQAVVLRVLANQVQAQLTLRLAVSRQRVIADRLRDADLGRELALDAAGLGAFDHKPDQGIRYYDKRALQLFGVTRQESEDLQLTLRYIHPADRPRVERAVAAVLAPSRAGPFRQTFRVHQPTGEERWLTIVGRSQFVNGVCTRFMGVIEDVTDAMRAEEHRRLLSNELNHRVKNTLAVMQSLVDSTLRSTSDVVEARAKINARIQAFGRAHDLLTASNWSAASITDVVQGVISTLSLPADRLEVGGPSVHLGPQPALQLALALHELATNALKYGALSNDTGRLTIAWSLRDDEAGQGRFHLSWTERGGPTVQMPTRKGFGTQLIDRATARAFNGAVELEYRPSGVQWRLDAPSSGLAESGRAPMEAG